MSVKICSVGDIMLGENVHHFGRGITSRYGHNYTSLIDTSVLDIVNQADILFGNLECSLMRDNQHKNSSLLRSVYAAPKKALSCFDNWSPILVFNIANNHFGQHGKGAMDYTLRCLEERGIYYIGRRPSPLEINVNGNRIYIWGVTIVKDRYGDDGYLKSSPENLLSDIDWGNKLPGSFWILSIHWGEEYLTMPSTTQQELADILAEKGVDLILGHHPHVIQPVRYVRGIPVAYSQGNFIFDQNFSKLTQIGLIMLAELGSYDLQLYQLKSRDYRISSCDSISFKELENFCKKNMSRLYPLIIRFLMKLELLSRIHEVPREVWAYLFHNFLRKLRDSKKTAIFCK